MRLRVDLMRETEFRYQGPVSKKFAGGAVGGFVGAVVLLWLAFAIEQEFTLRRDMARLNTDWQNIEGRYKAIKEKRANYAMCLAYQKELQPWGKTRANWADQFDELAQMIPPTIQLTRLSVRTDWEIIKPPPTPVTDPNAPTPPQPPGQPARRYWLSIQGRAAGEAGGDDAVQMVKNIKSSRNFSAVFETIRLQHMLRDTQPTDKADRSFSIEGQAEPRKME